MESALWTPCALRQQFAVYNNINAPKKYYIYPDFGHEYLPEFNDIGLEFLLDM